MVFTGSRPFTGGLCAGVEEAMADMKAGGRRLIKVAGLWVALSKIFLHA